jgi:hypothetical protein
VAKWQSRDFAASAANAYQAPIGTGLLKKESPPREDRFAFYSLVLNDFWQLRYFHQTH